MAVMDMNNESKVVVNDGVRRLVCRWALVFWLLLLSVTAPAWAAEERLGAMFALKTAYHTLFNVYVAGPEDAPYAALLVPDRWGLNNKALSWADRLASQGYRVVAVDYFDGRRAANEVMARELIKSIDPVWIEADLNSALAYLRLKPQRIVAITWGEGGEHAAQLARRMSGGISALVFYHQRSAEGLGVVAELAVPVLEVVTEQSLLQVGDQPGKAAEDTWRATVDFLKSNFQ